MPAYKIFRSKCFPLGSLSFFWIFSPLLVKRSRHVKLLLSQMITKLLYVHSPTYYLDAFNQLIDRGAVVEDSTPLLAFTDNVRVHC
jgi:hypothetical protein